MFNIEKTCIDSMKGFEEAFKDRPKLIEMYKKNFCLFFNKYAEMLSDGTMMPWPCGNIPAVWLRDGSQVALHVLPFVNENEELKGAVKAIIARLIKFIIVDPYANAFKKEPNPDTGWKDVYPSHPLVWERKYCIDDLTFPFWFAYRYYSITKDASVFNDEFRLSLNKALEVFEIEQHHREDSEFRFQRLNCAPEDTLVNEGLGAEIGYTGMVWSGFLPNDAAAKYGYIVASNLFAVLMLEYMHEICNGIWNDSALAERVLKLKTEIYDGVMKYGVVEHPKYGRILAYDTDGLGNHQLLDDALTPNLISLPYYKAIGYDDELYQNTRRFLLSKDNPNYLVGKAASGMASVHIPGDFIWPLAMVMQAMTSCDIDEVDSILRMLEITDNGTYLMHETINIDDPSIYSWDEFCMPSAMFCELIYRYANGILPSSKNK